MKKSIILFFNIILYSSQIYSQNEYWMNSNTTSWYNWISQVLFNTPIESCIPIMLIECDYILCNDQNTLCPPNDNTKLKLNGNEYTIDQVSYEINSGYTYQAFQKILENQFFQLNYKIKLQHSSCNIIPSSIAISHYIILNHEYDQLPDAIKLFILYHELQHHLYNDTASNHLEKIINLQSTNHETKKQLELHKESLIHHIVRYVEYRSDTQAMLAIQCPYCLKEIANMRQNIQNSTIPGTYHPNGYLCSWQFTPRIQELIVKKKCCQHHNNTGKQINLSIIDESTLLDRLIASVNNNFTLQS